MQLGSYILYGQGCIAQQIACFLHDTAQDILLGRLSKI